MAIPAKILSTAPAPPQSIVTCASVVYTEEKVKKVVASTSTAYVEESVTKKSITQITVLARSNATSKVVKAIHEAHKAMLPAMKNYLSVIRSVQESSFESVREAMVCAQSRLFELVNGENDFEANAKYFVMREFMKLV